VAGSVQPLPDGDTLICWAYASRISEHTPDGKSAMQAVLSVDADSYRGFKHPWIGAPLRPPNLHTMAVRNDTGILTIVHVSSNGATEVSQWRVSRCRTPNRRHFSGQWSLLVSKRAFFIAAIIPMFSHRRMIGTEDFWVARRPIILCLPLPWETSWRQRLLHLLPILVSAHRLSAGYFSSLRALSFSASFSLASSLIDQSNRTQ
jgi:hypothetical protein